MAVLPKDHPLADAEALTLADLAATRSRRRSPTRP